MKNENYFLNKKIKFRLLTFIISVTVCAAFFYFTFNKKHQTLETPPTAPAKLNIMSFNIRYGSASDGQNSWQYRKPILFDTLKTHNADIIAMQEALHFQLEEIQKNLPQYKYLGQGRDGQTKGEYSPILYKPQKFKVLESSTFWLSDTPEKIASITWSNACTRICTWAKLQHKESDAIFYLYNLHLDHVSQLSREKSIDLILEKTKGLTPLIITGDFNAAQDNPAIIKLKSAQLKDTFRQIHKDEADVKTFHAFTGETKGSKIDYIFVTDNIKTINAAILHDNTNGRYPSDHYPVTAKIILP